jgi:hypothetical protein
LLSLFVVPALYLSLGGGPRAAMTPADELMHRWAGVEPGAADERLEAAEPQVPAVMPQGDGAPPGSPTHSGADSGIQPRGDE